MTAEEVLSEEDAAPSEEQNLGTTHQIASAAAEEHTARTHPVESTEEPMLLPSNDPHSEHAIDNTAEETELPTTETHHEEHHTSAIAPVTPSHQNDPQDDNSPFHSVPDVQHMHTPSHADQPEAEEHPASIQVDVASGAVTLNQSPFAAIARRAEPPPMLPPSKQPVQDPGVIHVDPVSADPHVVELDNADDPVQHYAADATDQPTHEGIDVDVAVREEPIDLTSPVRSRADSPTADNSLGVPPFLSASAGQVSSPANDDVIDLEQSEEGTRERVESIPSVADDASNAEPEGGDQADSNPVSDSAEPHDTLGDDIPEDIEKIEAEEAALEPIDNSNSDTRKGSEESDIIMVEDTEAAAVNPSTDNVPRDAKDDHAQSNSLASDAEDAIMASEGMKSPSAILSTENDADENEENLEMEDEPTESEPETKITQPHTAKKSSQHEKDINAEQTSAQVEPNASAEKEETLADEPDEIVSDSLPTTAQEGDKNIDTTLKDASEEVPPKPFAAFVPSGMKDSNSMKTGIGFTFEVPASVPSVVGSDKQMVDVPLKSENDGIPVSGVNANTMLGEKPETPSNPFLSQVVGKPSLNVIRDQGNSNSEEEHHKMSTSPLFAQGHAEQNAGAHQKEGAVKINAPTEGSKPFGGSNPFFGAGVKVEEGAEKINAPTEGRKPFGATNPFFGTGAKVEESAVKTNAPIEGSKPFGATNPFVGAGVKAEESTVKPNAATGGNKPFGATTAAFGAGFKGGSTVKPNAATGGNKPFGATTAAFGAGFIGGSNPFGASNPFFGAGVKVGESNVKTNAPTEGSKPFGATTPVFGAGTKGEGSTPFGATNPFFGTGVKVEFGKATAPVPKTTASTKTNPEDSNQLNSNAGTSAALGGKPAFSSPVGHVAPMFGIQMSASGKKGGMSFSSPGFSSGGLSPLAQPFVPGSFKNPGKSLFANTSTAKLVATAKEVASTDPLGAQTKPIEQFPKPVKKRVAFAPTPVEISKKRLLLARSEASEKNSISASEQVADNSVEQSSETSTADSGTEKQQMVQVQTDEGLRTEVSNVSILVRSKSKVNKRYPPSTVRLTIRPGEESKLQFFAGNGPDVQPWKTLSSTKDTLRVRKVTKGFIMAVTELCGVKPEVKETKYFVHLTQDVFEAIFSEAQKHLQNVYQGTSNGSDSEKKKPTSFPSKASVGMKRPYPDAKQTAVSKKAKLLADKQKLLDKMSALKQKKGAVANKKKGVAAKQVSPSASTKGKKKTSHPFGTISSTAGKVQQAVSGTDRAPQVKADSRDSAKRSASDDAREPSQAKRQKVVSHGHVEPSFTPTHDKVEKQFSTPSNEKDSKSEPSTLLVKPPVQKEGGAVVSSFRSTEANAIKTSVKNGETGEQKPSTDSGSTRETFLITVSKSSIASREQELSKVKEEKNRLQKELNIRKEKISEELSRSSAAQADFANTLRNITNAAEIIKSSMLFIDEEKVARSKASLQMCDTNNLVHFFDRLHTFRPSSWGAFQDNRIGALECALRGWYNSEAGIIRSSEGAEIVLSSMIFDAEGREAEIARVRGLLDSGHVLLSGWVGKSCPDAFRTASGGAGGWSEEAVKTNMAGLKKHELAKMFAEIVHNYTMKVDSQDVCENVAAFNWAKKADCVECSWCNKQVPIDKMSKLDIKKKHYSFCAYQSSKWAELVEQNMRAIKAIPEGKNGENPVDDVVMADV